MKNKAVFFDRDGIVNDRKIGGYIEKIEEFVFIPGFFEFFEVVKENYLTILVTNQQGISKGIMSEADLDKVHRYMQARLKEHTGRNFDDIYYCKDLEESNSYYRKPNPGMLLDAIKKWNIDKSASWMIGDDISDYEAGYAAGVRTILIGNYNKKLAPNVDIIFKDIRQVIKLFR